MVVNCTQLVVNIASCNTHIHRCGHFCLWSSEPACHELTVGIDVITGRHFITIEWITEYFYSKVLHLHRAHYNHITMRVLFLFQDLSMLLTISLQKQCATFYRSSRCLVILDPSSTHNNRDGWTPTPSSLHILSSSIKHRRLRQHSKVHSPPSTVSGDMIRRTLWEGFPELLHHPLCQTASLGCRVGCVATSPSRLWLTPVT